MQRYTIFFIAVNVLRVSGGLSAHHQKLKTVHTASGICQTCLLLPLDVFKLLPHTLTREWQQLEYRIVVCRVTRGAHIEHL
jgi:hypothetical protein